MGEIDDLRERESGAEDQNRAAAASAAVETGTQAEWKWPLGVSLLIAALVSIILWAGIFIFAMRFWRWV